MSYYQYTSNMAKKKYIAPQTTKIMVQVENMLVTSVYISNVGTTDDAAMGRTNDTWHNW